jgi:drug/metabolite transporter (DMT)-like permease
VSARRGTAAGLVIAVVAAASFGMSGPFSKPLLESGWSPIAAVTFRALIGGVVLAPFAIVSLRGRWRSVWDARVRIILMATVGVAATQLGYFAAIQRIPVSTAILMEYTGPLLLVIYVSIRTRRMPKAVVLIGSIIAVGGLVLVVSPDGHGALDPLGLLFGGITAIGCAAYFLIAERPSRNLPPVALASVSLLIGSAALALVGAARILPFQTSTRDVTLLGGSAPWWLPLVVIGIVATAIAYATSITATEILGSRLGSFMGLLEVVAAALYAWILLGQQLGIPQLIGGVLILGGIAFVRSEKTDAPLEAVPPVQDAEASAEATEPGMW